MGILDWGSSGITGPVRHGGLAVLTQMEIFVLRVPGYPEGPHQGVLRLKGVFLRKLTLLQCAQWLARWRQGGQVGDCGRNLGLG